MRKFLRLLGERELNLIAIILLCVALSFGFCIEFFFKEIPCTLCFLQRLCLMGIAFCLFLNLLFGISSKFYGFALIWALLGMACSLRHIALNVCKPIPAQAFLVGPLRLYTWSFISFFASILGIALLLMYPKKTHFISFEPKKDKPLYIAAGVIFFVILVGFCSIVSKQGFAF